MATRMQQRRGTSAQWSSANPVLAAGEIGFETDTNQFKMGDGVNTWTNLAYFVDEDGISGSLSDYVPIALLGVADGVATLDENGFVPASQLDIDVTSEINAAISSLVDGAPGVLDTLNELAAAIGDDADFITTINNSIATKADASHTHLIADITDVTAMASELNILDGATLSTTELNYLSGVTSGIQSQLDNKLSKVSVISDKSSNYTLSTSDIGTTIRSTGDGIIITVPDVLSDGESINFLQAGSGKITFNPSGVTLRSLDGKIRTANQYTEARIFKAGGEYYLTGNLAAIPEVNGGTLFSDSTYYYRLFTSSGTLEVLNDQVEVEVLAIGGGGGGGNAGYSSGGGAGGVLNASGAIPAGSHAVIVGAGGEFLSSGNNSSVSGFIAYGGGGAVNQNVDGVSGGSGSGGGANQTSSAGRRSGGSGVNGQGNSGGQGCPPTYGGYPSAGGGGGAGAAGGSADNVGSVGGNGGAGTSDYADWRSATSTGVSGGFAGGGGGGGPQGGIGGGFGATDGRSNTNATALSGSGGGGSMVGGAYNAPGGKGGSGLLIVRYLKSEVEVII